MSSLGFCSDFVPRASSLASVSDGNVNVAAWRFARRCCTAYERRAGHDPEETQLVLEVVAHVLAAVIVARLQTRGHPLGISAEERAHPLPQRLDRLEARPRPRRMDADALSRAMVHDHEDGRGPLAPGQAARRVHPPHRTSRSTGTEISGRDAVDR